MYAPIPADENGTPLDMPDVAKCNLLADMQAELAQYGYNNPIP